MLDVICVGDTIYDIFIKPSEVSLVKASGKYQKDFLSQKMLCFGYGQKIALEDVDYSLGGSACNVAVGLKKLGLNVGLASFCAQDYYGRIIIDELKDRNVNLDYFLERKRLKTSFSLVFDHKKDRTILIYKDKSFDYSKIKLPTDKKSDWIYTSNLGSGYESLYKTLVNLGSCKDVKIALNPGKRQLKEKKRAFLSLLKICELVFINKEEAKLLAQIRFDAKIEEIYKNLLHLDIKNLIITDGTNGAYFRNKEERKIYHQKAVEANAIDSTGAGDAFSSGFMASYMKDPQDIERALDWGIINGAKVTEKVGGQAGLQSRF